MHLILLTILGGALLVHSPDEEQGSDCVSQNGHPTRIFYDVTLMLFSVRGGVCASCPWTLEEGVVCWLQGEGTLGGFQAAQHW